MARQLVCRRVRKMMELPVFHATRMEPGAPYAVRRQRRPGHGLDRGMVLDPREPKRLPLLFALDAQLAIANGFFYRLNCRDTAAVTAGMAARAAAAVDAEAVETSDKC